MGEHEIDDQSFGLVLEPLKGLNACVFEVELNVQVPSSVRERLGSVPFTLMFKQRAYRDHLYII